MEYLIPAVFIFVYVGMLVGKIPGLALDRTGVAVLGAVVLVAGGSVTLKAAWDAVDVSTLSLLLGLMVVSAHFRLSGFYATITRRIAGAEASPEALLGLLIVVVGILSAVLANDVVCLAVAPVLLEGCVRRRLDPVPFLLALACAANVGSAATLIGNPQNMLIGQVLGLSFSKYLLDAGIPAVAGLLAVWSVIASHYRGRWHKEIPAPEVEAAAFSSRDTVKGLAVLSLLVLAFLLTPWPRDVLALAAAAIILLSRRMSSRDILGLVDWQLLMLFIGLFVVNHSVQSSGLLGGWLVHLGSTGVDIGKPIWLFVVTAVLSNLVSNVPATMLLLPSATHPLGGPILALASTLAGNLLIVGSIANIIVVDQAGRLGVKIGWKEHARVGVPVTLLTLLIAGAWLVLMETGFQFLR
jgi:Na+/H+ antiporter NhaD/arsenite permease-like protein